MKVMEYVRPGAIVTRGYAEKLLKVHGACPRLTRSYWRDIF